MAQSVFATRLAIVLAAKELENELLAAAMGSSPSTISRWQNPRRPKAPSAPEIRLLSYWLEVPADYLLGRIELSTSELQMPLNRLKTFAAWRREQHARRGAEALDGLALIERVKARPPRRRQAR